MTVNSVFLSGLTTNPSRRIHLRAGPLHLLFENGDLRQVRLGEIEIIQRIYIAVRDHNWGTIASIVSNLQLQQDPECFIIEYDGTCQQGNIDFRWHSRITGNRDGCLVFGMDGTAHSSFLRNRIGFCVLHPAKEWAGHACLVQHSNGTAEVGFFPERIAPHQPFTAMTGITHTILPGLQAELTFEGDLFEMEDQRNWSDASFKTYCTPLSLIYPAPVQAGEQIQQRISMKLIGDPPIPTAMTESNMIHIGIESSKPSTAFPPLGTCLPEKSDTGSIPPLERIRALGLSHLRLDLDIANDMVHQRLREADRIALTANAALEIALHLGEDAEDELRMMASTMAIVSSRVIRWIIFRKGELCTDPHWIVLAKKILSATTPGAAFGGGADSNFTELNRGLKSIPPGMDFVVYALNPQVHAFDNLSLVENLSAQAETVQSAQAIAGNKAVIVSPVTFKPRFNVVATVTEAPPPPGSIPPQVDLHQLSLFGAGWTLGSIKHLAQGGANSLTFFEGWGWRGLMESPQGSLLAEAFPSSPNMVFPVWHLFTDLAECNGAELLTVRNSAPPKVETLALAGNGVTCLWLANLNDEPARVTVHNLPPQINLRILDEENLQQALQEPETWRFTAAQQLDTNNMPVELILKPFAFIHIQYQGETP